MTLRVAPQSRATLALYYDQKRRGREQRGAPVLLRHGQRSVRFTGCPADEPKFSEDGVVGARTFFPGALIATEPQCAHLTARVRGEQRVHRIALALGKPC